MQRDLTRQQETTEVQQEGNLLIEAVSLLVQRQRETETWVGEQLWQAEQRAVEADRRYAELESRLAGIESHLAQLVHEVEPADDGRIARLREQIQDLRADQPMRADDITRPIPPINTMPPVAVVPPAPPPIVEPIRQERVDVPPPAPVAPTRPPVASAPPPAPRYERVSAAPPPARAVAPAGSASPSMWELLGTTQEDRFGVVLIGFGAIAVLYALLTQLKF